MKTLVNGLLKGRITRRSLLAATLPFAGASLALGGSQSADKGVYRLGGSWIGTDNTGFAFTHLQVPLDPAGKTAAIHLYPLTWSQAMAEAFAALGGDGGSDWVGHVNMIDRDTANGTVLGYLTHSGNPQVVILIFVVSGIFRFTDRDTILCDYTTSYYPPSSDYLPHGDPFPPGPMPGATITLKRVPVL